ncbi:formate dehydrogenase accessory protein [Gemmata obscuriglobus]|uniref:Sulfur carrier protein FdhD n=1 Tax=Gemmata obscuriglobus TaxID=114 RepID=A0A2Z3GU53_9BACT|nr:formate dehydrogenase accessory sulfurtransferase FdhD [Gemmata obscuriglobus]AWM37293.1 formate dehydrogenase accessory sulfurtransferase FdhD [Gemmata obscuriglobus]QEG29960.1 formate dehydrogenase accessory protein [Gemmata obscuriglobus]VTS09279.1 formate dehydrogenase : Protein FdhD homolog OS=Amycolatopsis japonica GN=fdhD1 PE=3 SV=1: FdhD-NarQ [Gemmata obscuriglobus UQM 2246]
MYPAETTDPQPSDTDPATARAVVFTLTSSAAGSEREDTIAVEAPLELRIGGRPVTVLMRTPGHDEELVTGFLFGEGVIADADDIIAFERPDAERANVLNVRLMVARRAFNLDRPFYSNSSCGICGKRSLESVELHAPAVQSSLTISRTVLTELPERLRAAQPVFARTGGVHASGLFTAAGELVAVREDVGRHNALDKLVGRALNEGQVPLSGRVLLVSGRVSYELVQKAVAAGIPVLAAVGAPSSLAVELATRFGITLIGFLRPSGMNVYANPRRVVD